MASGNKAVANKGKVMMIRISIVMTCVKLCKNVLYESDTLLSVRSTSFENLLIIRPRGVVSKKDIGARMILLSAYKMSTSMEERTLLCNFSVALFPKTVRVNPKKKMKSP